MAEPGFSPDPLPAGTRIACRIEYLGTRYNGWQSQPGPAAVTVQDTVEAALGRIAAADVRVHCAGRTDTGVHAHCQIIHFDAPTARAPKAWVLGANAELPDDIRVHWARPVPGDFHARFTATARRYRYLVVDSRVRPALLGRQVTWHRRPLAEGAMHRAAQALLGERDFSAFRAASCQSSSPMRNVSEVAVSRHGPFVVIDIRANAFLHHMVRNIAGSLLAVGDGRAPVDWVETLLAARDRTAAADTAAAAGLYLVDVTYPAGFGLPQTPFGPMFLAGVA